MDNCQCLWKRRSARRASIFGLLFMLGVVILGVELYSLLRMPDAACFIDSLITTFSRDFSQLSCKCVSVNPSAPNQRFLFRFFLKKIIKGSLGP